MSSSNTKVSDLIANFLKKKKIKYIFGIIGSANSHIFDSIKRLGYTEKTNIAGLKFYISNFKSTIIDIGDGLVFLRELNNLFNENSLNENDLDFTEEFNPIGISADLQRVVFIFDNKEEAEKYLKDSNIEFIKRNMAWQVNMSTQSI